MRRDHGWYMRLLECTYVCPPSRAKWQCEKQRLLFLEQEKTTKARESREDERVSVPCLYFLFIQLEEELNDL